MILCTTLHKFIGGNWSKLFASRFFRLRVGLSTENRYPTHPKKPFDLAREPADSTPVTIGGGSPPPEPVTGGLVGGFSLPKSEKPESICENP